MAGEGGAGGSSADSVKRNLDKRVLHYISTINLHLPYQLCQRSRAGHLRGDLVRKLQHRLNITDAPHFYNLASLEGTLACLMHVTARPGWSRQSSQLDAASLCGQLLNSLLEVVWSFHIGRGGTSRSFMGKGVTKSTTLCLRHLAHEMIHNSEEDQEWVKNWLYSHQQPHSDSLHGLDWMLTLWAYRDAEVRAAGVGLAVALTSCEAGRLMVTSHTRHVPGGVWGAALSVLMDPTECSVVCQQAALLLTNLTSQSMPSGDIETSPGTWQGPLVTDTDYQVMLVGINALSALLSHTNFYSVTADIISSLYTPSVIQPILVTAEIPLGMDSTANTSFTSTNTSSLDHTGGTTALTSVSSLSTHPPTGPTTPTTPLLTPNLSSSSTAAAKAMAAVRENSLSSSSNIETPRGSQAPEAVTAVTTQSTLTGGPHLTQGQTISSPGLVAAVVRLLNNLVNLSPQSSLGEMRSHSIITSLINVVDPGLVQVLCQEMSVGHMTSANALSLAHFLRLYEAVAQLLTSCVLLDTNCRMELLAHTEGVAKLASLLLLQWPETDDLGEVCATVSLRVLELLNTLLQTTGHAALTALTPILGHIWPPLSESLCSILEDSSSRRSSQHAACLNFLALLCCEEAKSLVKNPDRISEPAAICELLDAALHDTPPSKTKSSEDLPQTSGAALGKVLVNLFDTATSPIVDSKTGTKSDHPGGASRPAKLRVVSALKSLLAVSHTATQTALAAGLVESTLEHVKQTHAQLSLETLGLVSKGGKKEEPYLSEIIIMFDFLRNFMYGNADVKVACLHSGLPMVLQRLWAWCQEEATLLSSALSLMVTYTAHCDSACGSLTTSQTPHSSASKGQGSLLQYVLRLAQRELDRDECSPLLRQTFTLLTNLVMNAECRNILWKSPFLNQFSNLNPRRKRGKLRVAMETLWCELLLALSFSVDGQQIILKIPDVLTVFVDMMEMGSTRCQHCATLIVRNLCCHATNKPKLLATDRLVTTLVTQISDPGDDPHDPSPGSGSRQLVASSALWALVHNNHKARVQVKGVGVAPQLAEALHQLAPSASRSQATLATCQNLRSIISAVRE